MAASMAGRLVRLLGRSEDRASCDRDGQPGSMKMSHVMICAGAGVTLAGAILGAAWLLKPVPAVPMSQDVLQQREEVERWLQDQVNRANLTRCAAATGKTVETLNRNDPAQEAIFRKCMWPELSRSRLRRVWDKIRGMW
jgi:hypothetical protein